MRLTNRGRVAIAILWIVSVLLLNFALRDWNWYGGFA